MKSPGGVVQDAWSGRRSPGRLIMNAQSEFIRKAGPARALCLWRILFSLDAPLASELLESGQYSAL